MSTTTIRLPDKLKSRLAHAAEQSGKTAHSFILEAIAEKTENSERRQSFHADAEKRFANLIKTKKSVPWTDVRAYVEKRVAGKKARPPASRKLKP